nr:phosphotransferase family protein [Brevibacterium daeguense]
MKILTGGASRQMWKVTTTGSGDWQTFILRMDHPSDPQPQANAREAEVLIAAHAAGVPCPAVLDYSSDAEVLGTPFLILAFVEGQTIARKILRDDEFAVARTRLPAQLGRAIGLIHQVDPTGLDLEDLQDPVGSLVADYDELGFDRPALLLGLRELERRRPEPAPRRTLVHGDFRLGNLMVDQDGLAAVLDWEIPHFGDPFGDLGYVCMRAWRFGGPGRVAGVGDEADFLAAYEAETGFRPSPEQLTWWEAKATAQWGVGCLKQMQRSVPGHANELELLAIGRRTAEQEYDLLNLLYPEVEPAPYEPPDTRVGTAGSAEAPGATLFSEPSAEVLLAALESYLDTDLIHGTGEPNRFKARVAKNALSLLRRERTFGPNADRWYAEQLSKLGARSERELTERVRGLPDTSAADPQIRALVAVFKTASRLRLEVSNPKYLQEPAAAAAKNRTAVTNS